MLLLHDLTTTTLILQSLGSVFGQTFDLLIILLVSKTSMILVFFFGIQGLLHVKQFIEVSRFIKVFSHFCFCELFMKNQNMNILVICVISSGHKAEEFWLNHIFITLYNFYLFSKDLMKILLSDFVFLIQ